MHITTLSGLTMRSRTVVHFKGGH